MPKNTSISLGEHFDTFVAEQLNSGRYSSTSEVIRAGLRLLEDAETRLGTLRKMLQDGENSGVADYDYDSFIDAHLYAFQEGQSGSTRHRTLHGTSLGARATCGAVHIVRILHKRMMPNEHLP